MEDPAKIISSSTPTQPSSAPLPATPDDAGFQQTTSQPTSIPEPPMPPPTEPLPTPLEEAPLHPLPETPLPPEPVLPGPFRPGPEKPEPEPKQLGETPLPPIPPSVEQSLVFRKSEETQGNKPKKPFLIGGAILTLLLVSTAVAVFFVQTGRFGFQKKAVEGCTATRTYTGASGCGQGSGASVTLKVCIPAGCPATSITYHAVNATCNGTEYAGCGGACGNSGSNPTLSIPAGSCAEATVSCGAPACGSCQVDIDNNGTRRWQDSGCSGPAATPPTCIITGPSSLTVGGVSGTFTATATGNGNTVRRIEIWRAQENWLEKDKPNTGWTLIDKPEANINGVTSLNGNWIPTMSNITTLGNKWWVVCNAYYDANGARGMTNSCSGNPWGTDGTMADCGPNDNMQVALLTLPTPTPPASAISCNSRCSTNEECKKANKDYICHMTKDGALGYCRYWSCPTETKCACLPTPTPTPTPTPPPTGTGTPPRVCCCWQGGCSTGYCQMLSSSSCQAPAAIRESTCCTTNPPTSTPIPTATATPIPTSTSTPTSTPTATPIPTATPTLPPACPVPVQISVASAGDTSTTIAASSSYAYTNVEIRVTSGFTVTPYQNPTVQGSSWVWTVPQSYSSISAVTFLANVTSLGHRGDACGTWSPPVPTPTSSPLPSCLNVQVAVAGGGSLNNLKIGDSLTFTVSFGGTVEDVGVVIKKEGIRVKTLTAGSQQTNSWTSSAYTIESLGSYEISAYVKINGVWQ